MQEKVSLIIPVYNTPKVLFDECIDSILEQTYNNIEIIIVDDGSVFDVAQMCDEYLKKDKRIRVIHQKNQGVSVARNVGIENATGKWISFVDGDDWLEKDAIENLISMKMDSDIVISKNFSDNQECKCIFDTDIIEGEQKPDLIISLFVENYKYIYMGPVWAKLYKKDFLIKNNIAFTKGIPRGEDMLFNFEAFCKAKKISCLSKYTYHYRNNELSVMNKYDETIIDKYDELLIIIKNKYNEILKEHENEKSFEAIRKNFDWVYHYYVFRNINVYCIKYIYHKQNARKNKAEILKDIICRQPYKEAIKNVKFGLLPPRRKGLYILLKMKLFRLIRLLYSV